MSVSYFADFNEITVRNTFKMYSLRNKIESGGSCEKLLNVE